MPGVPWGELTNCTWLQRPCHWASIENNQGFIPNYSERYRQGEWISAGFVESTVNQMVSKRFCKKQQMVRHEVAERNERMAHRSVALSCVLGMG
jgi:hypothetical protein